jgi:hypothetical protein
MQELKVELREVMSSLQLTSLLLREVLAQEHSSLNVMLTLCEPQSQEFYQVADLLASLRRLEQEMRRYRSAVGRKQVASGYPMYEVSKVPYLQSTRRSLSEVIAILTARSE